MKYRYRLENFYEVEASSQEEALNLLNSEREYNFLQDTTWELLEESEV